MRVGVGAKVREKVRPVSINQTSGGGWAGRNEGREHGPAVLSMACWDLRRNSIAGS